MSTGTQPHHHEMARKLVAETRANGGLAPVDLERFWAEQEIAHQDPWSPKCPQMPLGIGMSSECVFDELGVPEDWRRITHDPTWRVELNKVYNDKAETIVGRRLLGEDAPDPARQYPPHKGLADVFEAQSVWEGQSYWLHQSANTPDELAALLDRVDSRDIRSFILPEGWEQAKARLMPLGVKPPLYRHQRGPVTFAMSVYGPENLIFLILDQPDLAERFRDTILRVMLEVAAILDAEAGYTPADAPHGWHWADDNCCLLNAEMYDFFAAPILKGIFDRYCPDEADTRYQHSDSPMGHHLPTLGRLGMNGVNFGPTVMADEIRLHLPKAVIYGQLAPFTFSRNEEENIVAELLRDFEMTREKRGLLFSTAGSINNGSRLTGLRLIMSAIQRYARYDG